MIKYKLNLGVTKNSWKSMVFSPPN